MADFTREQVLEKVKKNESLERADLRHIELNQADLDGANMRRADLEASRFATHWELILQTFSIPLGDFTARNRSLDLGSLRAVRFVFDRVHAGEVSIDQIGFSDLPAEFLGARVDGR